VTRDKGQHQLVAALARLPDLDWQCSVVGSLTVAPDHATGLKRQIHAAGLEDRVRLVGPRTGRELDEAYTAADVLVHPSRSETYGMVVTEALARGIPVLATDVGGLPEALGMTPSGRPGLLTPPGDVFALASSLKRWLTDGGLRRRLREAAGERRVALAGWPETADRVSRVLGEVA